MTTKHGILPYDTDDNSVIFRCPLTSLASITDIGGTDTSTGNNVFDSEKGISPRINGSSLSGIRFRLSLMTLESGSHNNTPQGQISFEVERKALSIPSSATNSESDGYDNGSDNMALLYWIPDNNNVTQSGYLYKRNTANGYDLYSKAGSGGTEAGAKYISSNNLTSQYARVTIAFQNNDVKIYVDGLHIQTRSRGSSNNLTQFGDLFLGSYGNSSAIPSWNNQYYIRNIIMSSRPVAFSYHPYLAHLMMVGDSFAGGIYQVTTTTKGELNENNVIASRLNELGFGFSTYDVYSNGGGTVRDAGSDPLQDDVNGSGKTRATAASEKPTFIIFQGGANDQGAYDSAFLTDLKDHVKEYMADGTTYTANVAARKMILVCQYSGTSVSANLKSIHIDIKSIPEWWDAAYPSRSGSIQVVDPGNELTTDGTTIIQDYMNSDEVHPNSLGDYIYGNAIAYKMLTMLG